MLFSRVLLTFGAEGFGSAHFVIPNDDQDMIGLAVNSIPAARRVECVQKTNVALFQQSGPCPFAAFGTIIVNHTSDEVVCEGANFGNGDPTSKFEDSDFAKQGMAPT
ncbi:cytidine and deoxycytidylate deaminase zinc-binding region [Colletotrichum orchidophilum]|uniref:Cytidine and deoxycytidylate deaminase zinc-binding region n=1 Tax=Colletotrichum orchidophilum TaxID=1209926 RepID=A0A1G4B7L1_9PEZI|nr:cytidine and deoxycytidylate deaminase zinc-binding region [Colletotrichum orchidophilum]OHE97326.1 cytidine and deoxycytidylate deaminase zinc-binding region [Colletotrichum orchidophilum]